MSEKQYPSAEQIANWKQEYRTLHEFSTEGGGKAIIRQPRMLDLERAMDASKKPNAKSLDFNRVLYRNCRLWESHDLLGNDEDALQVLTSIGQVAEVREATVKKL